MRRIFAVISMIVILLSVVVLNVCGRAVLSPRSPHNRVWFSLAMRGQLRDAHGHVITRSTHPSEFADRPMVQYYSHGWPYEACMRWPYTEPGSWAFWNPDHDTPSSRWPVDSARCFIYRVPLLIDFAFGIGLILIGRCLVIAIIQPYRPRSTDSLP